MRGLITFLAAVAMFTVLPQLPPVIRALDDLQERISPPLTMLLAVVVVIGAAYGVELAVERVERAAARRRGGK